MANKKAAKSDAAQYPENWRPVPNASLDAIARLLNTRRANVVDPCSVDGTDVLRLISRMQNSNKHFTVAFGLERLPRVMSDSRTKLDIGFREGVEKVDIQEGIFNLAYLNPNPSKYGRLVQYLEATKRLISESDYLILVIPEAVLFKPGAGKKPSVAHCLVQHFSNFTIYRSTDEVPRLIVMAKAAGGTASTTEAQLSKMAAEARLITSRLTSAVYVGGAVDISPAMFGLNDGGSERFKEAARSAYPDYDKLLTYLPRESKSKRPLMALRKGHLAQLLAAGMMDGVVVHPESQERLLVKGSSLRVEHKTEGEDGETKETSREVVSIRVMESSGNIICLA